MQIYLKSRMTYVLFSDSDTPLNSFSVSVPSNTPSDRFQ